MSYLSEGDMGICGVAVLMFFYCGVVVISNPLVCDVCVFHAAVFGEMKLFAVLEVFDLPFSNLNLTLCKLH